MEMEQQFSLSWNNFHGNLSKGFAGLLGNGEFVDVTIAVDGHLLQAHKVILSICSPYFKKMFQLNPCQHPIVVLRDVSHKAMKDLLQFMYHGEVSVKREDLTSFIGTAEVLQIKGLTNKQTDNENCKSGKELQTNEIVTKENTPSIETDAHERKKSSPDLDILKQKEFIDRLQKLNHLKRKSEEYLQKSYFSSDSMSLERRSKREKPSNKITDQQTNNYDLFNHVYDDNPLPLDASTNYKSQSKHDSQDSSKNDVDKESISFDSNLDIKTECDENEIIVTDPACMTPKSYEMARDNQKDNDYQSPQNNALSLVVNNSEESNLPVRYKYIYSRKGHKQLVHMNFVYTKHSTSNGKTAWRCVQYFSLNRCPATVETVESMIYATNHQHNHEDCYEKLLKNNIYYETSHKQ